MTYNDRMERGVGVRVIVGYKLVKAALGLVLGVVLLVFSTSVTAELRLVASMLRAHALGAWSFMLADRVAGFATREHVALVGVAALFDAAFSAFEGWALHKRYGWSRWLIVVSTSALVPFEIYELARRFTIGRALVLVVNAWIVIYLVRNKVDQKSARRSSLPSPVTGGHQ